MPTKANGIAEKVQNFMLSEGTSEQLLEGLWKELALRNRGVQNKDSK